MNRTRTIAAAAITAAALTVPAGLAASASAAPLRAVTGDVALSGPLQYAQFHAVQGHGGLFAYTNFTYAEPGSGVFVPAGEDLPAQATLANNDLDFLYQGNHYIHTLNGGLALTALSPDRLSLAGTGSYNGGGDPWHITGAIHGNQLTAVIIYDAGSAEPGYTVHMTGTIAPDGSAAGTASTSDSQALTWTMKAGSFDQVLHFIAPVNRRSVRVSPRADNAVFRYTVPAAGLYAVPSPLGGTHVTVWVHDGDTAGTAGDSYAHGVTAFPPAPVNYAITGGTGITVTP